MSTNRAEERDLFLKYLSDVYLQNPDLPFSNDIVYNELSRFNVSNGENIIIDNESLLAVQLGLNNKFRANGKVNTFSNGYFWVIENRMGRNDNVFFSDMYNSIKLYVSIDASNIYRISELLFNFMINEGIVMQSKIAKGMRNDALVCRVATREDALKISKFLDKLNYFSVVKPNPFLLDNGKVSIAMDGHLSYNRTLSKLIREYLVSKKNENALNNVSSDDLNKFIKSQIEFLKGDFKNAYMDLYQINSGEKYRDFIMICDIISKNLDNSLSLDEIFKYQDIKDVQINDVKRIYSKQDEDRLLYVINALTNYYSVDDVHKIIMKFIEGGDIRLFTRKDNIRTIISENFSQQDVKNIVSDLGWNAFLSASKVTYDKYGEEWLYNAIDKYLKGLGISGFTRDGGVRSRLGLIIPSQLLQEVIMNKTSENGMLFDTNSLTGLVLEEINKLEQNKGNGRKK